MLCISAVAAADNNGNVSVVGTDNGNLMVENEAVSNTLHSSSGDVLSAGNSWYVKAGATGGDGSEDKPYANLKSVTNNANYKENDVIYVMDGTYTGSNNYGIALKENTTVKAYEGANPIFNANKQESIFVLSENGITLQGLTLLNGGGSIAKTAQGANAWCGGAICNSGNNLVVDGCTIRNNDPISYGGGIYSKGKNTEIKNSKFEGCDASIGGAIAIDGPYAKIVGNTFTNNAGVQGAAVNIYNYGAATIANNTFTRNHATNNKNGFGGGIVARAGQNVIKNNTFNTNFAAMYGAAVATVNSGTTIDNCTFTGNQIFNDNSDTNWGGAIYAQGENTKIVNSKFSNNAVRDNGGAICARNNDILIENCSFDKNQAGRGGAIYIPKVVSGHEISNTIINNCTFDENGVITTQDGQPNLGTKGGAIYSLGVDTHVTNSNFNNNIAMSGGAILYENGHNYLENNTFKGNKAVRYGGGAISSARFGDTINNCTFEDNFATGYGGAVSADYPKITNSKFIGNEANHGGAICTITADISDSEFRDNVADDNYAILAATKVTESNNVRPGQEAISMNHTTYLEMEYDQEKEIAIMPGYYAYCMEEYSDYPQYGVLWENLRFAQNSLSEENIGEYLKILIYKYWNDDSQHANLQKLVNAFTDRNFRENENPIVQEIISLYDSGYRVPTANALRFYDNGTVAMFNFKEILTPSSTQNVFAFNITYNPNLTVEKELITDPVYTDKDVDFNITVTNTGECNLTNIWINDTDFSEGLVYKSFKSPYNWTYDSESKLWILNDTLAPKGSAYIIFTFTVTKAGDLTNNVTTGLGNHTFDNDTVTFKVYTPNMTVEKISLNSTVTLYVNDIIAYNITVRNTGDCVLSDVTVVEKYDDSELEFVEFKGANWFVGDDKHTFIYNGDLDVKGNLTFTVFFKALTNGTIVNNVTAKSDLTNETKGNNTTHVYKPNMTVVKVSLNSTDLVIVNGTVAFNITVINTGDCVLGDVNVTEAFNDNEFKFIRFAGDDWTSDDNVTFKYLKPLEVNGNATFTVYFKALVNGTLVNNVTARSNVTKDTNDTANVTVYSPNMTVEKISNNKTVKVGELTSFTIVVKNTGDCNLTGVYVIDKGADGLKYDHTVDETGKWSYDGNGRWNYNGTLGIGESAEFTIVFKAMSEGFKVNNAIAGNNITNDTVNSTNTTNVTVEHNNETDVPENETDVPDNTTVHPEKPVKPAKAKIDSKATGNPLMALIVVLIALGFASRRKKQ